MIHKQGQEEDKPGERQGTRLRVQWSPQTMLHVVWSIEGRSLAPSKANEHSLRSLSEPVAGHGSTLEGAITKMEQKTVPQEGFR